MKQALLGSTAATSVEIWFQDEARVGQKGSLSYVWAPVDNVVLLPLPPYSPELNPMENVWQFLRANKLSATVWESYDEIVDACVEAWNWFVHDQNRIESIGARDWATVNV